MINKNLTITGPGANLLSVSGNNSSRVFQTSSGATVTINNLTVTNGNGGGILVYDSILNLNNSTVSNNSAISGAGICITPSGLVGTANVSNCTISGNTATSIGGGIYSAIDGSGTACGILTLTNSTLSGNSAPTGGGLAAYCTGAGSVTITNSTLSNNTANASSGGGIYNEAYIKLINSIVANNTGGDIVNLGSTTDAQYSLIKEGLSNINGVNSSNLTGDPLLGPQQDNGGPTQTIALLPGSPAINAGNNALAVDQNNQPLATDQRGPGFPRISPSNGTVDIGAFELQCINNPVVTNNNDAGPG